MKVFYALLVLCLIPILSKAQIDSVPGTTSTTHIHYETHSSEIPRYFTYKNLVFDMSYRGLRELMKEIKRDDINTYNHMLPYYTELERKHRTYSIIGNTTLIASGALMLSGIIFKKKTHFFKDDSLNRKEINDGLVVTGLGVLVVGGVIALLTAPTRTDIFTLINTNNKSNEKGKIKWQLGYNQTMKAPEVGLCYVF